LGVLDCLFGRREVADLPGFKVILRARAAFTHPAEGGLVLPIFDQATVAFAAVRSGSTLGTSPFEIGCVRPVHSRAYASPRSLLLVSQGSLPAARARFAGRDFHPLDDGAEFQCFIGRLLSALNFLVAPHVRSDAALEPLIREALRRCPTKG
jgi:hypothetical protein